MHSAMIRAKQYAIWAIGVGLVIGWSSGACAQATGSPPDAKTKPDVKDKAPVKGLAPPAKKEVPREKVATAEGTIKVDRPVRDRAIASTLKKLLPKYPGVRSVQITVDDGVVTLDGQVDDEQTLDDVTRFVERVEGVRLVLNRMDTDADVMTAGQLAVKQLGEYYDIVRRKWVVALMALGVMLTFLLLARLFERYAETLLAPFVSNVLLRSVVGSFLGAVLVFSGLMLALSILNLTRVVLSVVGLAGAVGLAVGFAFRDIAENFIASVLLGVRRPFQVGDYVQVAGQSGVVRSLNTRATVLVTLEGHHVRIPNATIFKEILTNTTASPSVRESFDVLVPYAASTASAMEAITSALRAQESVLPDPPARALVDGLQPEGVRLRVDYWVPSKGVDRLRIQSDARLRAKVALHEALVPAASAPAPAPAPAAAALPAPAPVESKVSPSPSPPDDPAQTRANLRQDERAAAEAATAQDNGRATPMEHVLNQSQGCPVDEGENLLDNGHRKREKTGSGA